jgi:hypothetical protein
VRQLLYLLGNSRHDVAINFSRQAFHRNDHLRRLSELARAGPVGGRQVFSEVALSEILDGKFDDPMLGLYGAHQILLSSGTERIKAIPIIVHNLRRLLGDNNPDVEALALTTQEGTTHTFTTPPMLRRAWSLMLDATLQRQDLIPSDSIAAAISTRVMATEPWLVWATAAPAPITEGVILENVMLESAVFADSVLDEEERLLELIDQILMGAGLRPNDALESAAIERAAKSLKRSVQEVTESYRRRQPSRTPVQFDEQIIHRLVRMLGVPGARVEELLKKRKASQQS